LVPGTYFHLWRFIELKTSAIVESKTKSALYCKRCVVNVYVFFIYIQLLQYQRHVKRRRQKELKRKKIKSQRRRQITGK